MRKKTHGQVHVTHEAEPAGDTPCGEGECYITITRTMRVRQQMMVDVPAGTAPNAHAREIVENIDHWEFGEGWAQSGDAEEVLAYATEVGGY